MAVKDVKVRPDVHPDGRLSDKHVLSILISI
jgi:hypothetical protein